VPSVLQVVEAYFTRWADSGAGAIDRDVLGTDQPNEIAAIFERCCDERLGSPAASGRFYLGSAGCVLGVRLHNGDDVVIKAFQSSWTASLLRAVQASQVKAAEGGVPCPAPVLPPTPIVEGRPNLSVVETWLPDPGMRPGGSDSSRQVSAQGLARQIAACRDMPEAADLEQHPLRTPTGDVYPTPHSPLFDFASTTEGAAWIDDIAREAARRREEDGAAPVVAHTDWSARNVRFNDHRILAVYDWDSVALVPASVAVGQAAMTWSVTADPGGTEFPPLDSVLAYLDDYDRAAEAPLSSRQYRTAKASAAYLLAYTARCEHSLDRRGLARPDQDAGRRRLADIGEALLG
jgi:hypothetical protein